METSQKEIQKPLEKPVSLDAKKPDLKLDSGQQTLYVTEVNVPITPTEEEKTPFDMNKSNYDDDAVNSDYDNMEDLMESETFPQNESVNDPETTAFENEAEKVPQPEPETLDECVELAEQTLEMVNNMEPSTGTDTGTEQQEVEEEKGSLEEEFEEEKGSLEEEFEEEKGSLEEEFEEEKGSLEEEFEAELNMEQTTVSVIARDQEEMKQEVQEIGSLEEEFEAQLHASMTEEAIAEQRAAVQMIAHTDEAPAQAAEQEILTDQVELLSSEFPSSQMAEPVPPSIVKETAQVEDTQPVSEAAPQQAIEVQEQSTLKAEQPELNMAVEEPDSVTDSAAKVSKKQDSSMVEEKEVIVEQQIMPQEQAVSKAEPAEDFIPDKTNTVTDNSARRPEVTTSSSPEVRYPAMHKSSPSPEKISPVFRKVNKVNKDRTKEEKQNISSLIPDHIRKEFEEKQEQKKRELELANEPMNIYLVIGGAVVMMTAMILMFAYSLGVTG